MQGAYRSTHRSRCLATPQDYTDNSKLATGMVKWVAAQEDVPYGKEGLCRLEAGCECDTREHEQKGQESGGSWDMAVE